MSLCEYRLLDNGIHEFILKDFTRAGVDAFIESIQEMHRNFPIDTPRPVLIDSSGGMHPISYLFTRLRTLPHGNSNARSRLAMVMQSHTLANVVGGLARVFPRLQIRFFKATERDIAIAWLLEF